MTPTPATMSSSAAPTAGRNAWRNASRVSLVTRMPIWAPMAIMTTVRIGAGTGMGLPYHSVPMAAPTTAPKISPPGMPTPSARAPTATAHRPAHSNGRYRLTRPHRRSGAVPTPAQGTAA